LSWIGIEVEAKVNPTESVEKVEKAIRNVLGEIELQRDVQGEHTLITSHLEGLKDLRYLRWLIRRMRIRDSVRKYLKRGIGDNVLVFGLNRQAAYVGRFSFYRVKEAPLGPIQIKIKGDAEEVVQYLCD
jgi:predicted RNA binding protein with dsRBD fold (UPF0201 family)